MRNSDMKKVRIASVVMPDHLTYIEIGKDPSPINILFTPEEFSFLLALGFDVLKRLPVDA